MISSRNQISGGCESMVTARQLRQDVLLEIENEYERLELQRIPKRR